MVRPEEVERAAAWVEERLSKLAPTGKVLLINNSGMGDFGGFPGTSLQRQLEVIDLNVRAMVEMTGCLLPFLLARGGTVINVASTMAFQPTAWAATYGASKAFVLHWTLALNEEWRGRGVRAMALCPGTTATEFFRAAGLGAGAVMTSMSMSTEEVVAEAYRAMARGSAQVVPGGLNKLYTFASAKLPKPLAARCAARALRRYRGGDLP